MCNNESSKCLGASDGLFQKKSDDNELQSKENGAGGDLVTPSTEDPEMCGRGTDGDLMSPAAQKKLDRIKELMYKSGE